MPASPFQFTLGRLMGAVAVAAGGLGILAALKEYPLVQMVVGVVLFAYTGALVAVAGIAVLVGRLVEAGEPAEAPAPLAGPAGDPRAGRS